MKPVSIQKVESEFGIEFKECNSFVYDKNGYITNEKETIKALKIEENSDVTIKIIDILKNDLYEIEELSLNCEIDLNFLKDLNNLKKLRVNISSKENLELISEVSWLDNLTIYIYNIEDLDSLKKLKELTSLTFSTNTENNNINFIKELSKLKFLSIHPSGLIDLSPISFLDKLEILMVYSLKLNNIEEIGKLKNLKFLDLDSCKIEQPDFIGELKNLKTLRLKLNGISNLSFLKKLSKIKSINIKSNPISDISIIGELTNLEYARIKRTKVFDVSPLRNLNKLKSVDLQENEISDITDLLKNESIKSVNLRGNKKIEIDFPKEVLEAGWEAIKQYSEKSKERIPFKNIKVLLLGNPNIGKSNLLEYLETNEVPILKDSTHGVRYKQIVLNDINFHIWDFGGQEYFHSTHKLFFSPNALNIILWGKDIPRNSDEIENQFFNLDYWLRIVEQLNYKSEKEEVLIIENKIDLNNPINQETILNQKELSENYKILNLSFTNFSLLNLKRTEIFKNIFLEKAESIISKFNYPAFYEVFWRRIQELNKDFVTVEEINNRPSRENIIAALKVFHNMGMLLYFHELIPDKVFCKPQVLLELLYEKILSKEKKDRLTQSEIEESITKNSLELSVEEVVNLLKYFDLIFEINDEKDVYFIPQYLKSINPHIKDLKGQIFIGSNIKVTGDNYLMSVAMQKIFSKYGSFVSKDDNEYRFWRNGIIIKKDGCVLMIELNREKQTIELYQDKEGENLILQKEIVDFILDLPEDVDSPKRNLDNHRNKRWKDVLNFDDEDYSPHFSERIQEYDGYLEEFERRNWENKYNWVSTFFNVYVSIDCVFFAEWKKIKENEDLSEINFCNEIGEFKKVNVKEYCYLIDKKNMQVEENNKELVKEVNSVTNNFNAPVNIGILGNDGKIEEFKVLNHEIPNSKSNSGLTNDELIAVKKWKNSAIRGFVLYFLFSLFLAYNYIQETNYIMDKLEWNSFKENEFSKLLIFVWSCLGIYLFYKLIYDRFFDPSKENSYIDLYRKRKK